MGIGGSGTPIVFRVRFQYGTGMDDDEEKKRLEKARENHLRRVAEHQRLRLSRSRRRDKHAPDFGKYAIYRLGPRGGEVMLKDGLTLDAAEIFLKGDRA